MYYAMKIITTVKSYNMGLKNLYGKGPHLLLRAGSRAPQKITTSVYLTA
jgi:hypothetical protein